MRYNRQIARAVLGERGPPLVRVPMEYGAAGELAARDHVLLCGFGRVGRNLARVLAAQGFEYLALIWIRKSCARATCRRAGGLGR